MAHYCAGNTYVQVFRLARRFDHELYGLVLVPVHSIGQLGNARYVIDIVFVQHERKLLKGRMKSSRILDFQIGSTITIRIIMIMIITYLGRYFIIL